METGSTENLSLSDRHLNVYDEKVKAVKSELKAKFLRFSEFPESHEDFAYYKERFRTNHVGLTKATMQREWKIYWGNKMEQEFFNELDAAKRQIWREAQSLSTVKTEDPVQIVEVKKEIITEDVAATTSKPDETKDEASQVPKQEEVPASKAEGEASAGRVESLLESYHKRVCEIKSSIREEFNGYQNDSSTYPGILAEKRSYIRQEITNEGVYSMDLVFNFEKLFEYYWKQRVEVLRQESIDSAVKMARANITNELLSESSVQTGVKVESADPQGATRKRSLEGVDGTSSKRQISEVVTSDEKAQPQPDQEKPAKKPRVVEAETQTEPTGDEADKPQPSEDHHDIKGLVAKLNSLNELEKVELLRQQCELNPVKFTLLECYLKSQGEIIVIEDDSDELF